MTISELIKHLQELQQKHGDLSVYMFDSYTSDQGWGDMETWNTDGVSASYHLETITLDGSGDTHEFIGLD